MKNFTHSNLIERPIFIVGPGRSGTTLMRTLLSAHPKIAIAPETHYMKYAENWEKNSSQKSTNIEEFWDEYIETIRFADLDIDANDCKNLIRNNSELTPRNLFAAMLTVYMKKLGKERAGEKTPGHVFYIENLLSWFPESRFILLKRDPRAVVASQLHTPWVKHELSRPGIFIGKRYQQIAHYADDWNKIQSKISQYWQKDERFLVVKYEKLVTDTLEEMEKICNFVGEDFDKTLFSNYENQNVHTPTSQTENISDDWRDWRSEHHAKSLKPISTDSIYKWRNELSKFEVSLIEGFCKQDMLKSGYKPIRSRLNHFIGSIVTRLFLSAGKYEEKLRKAIK